jgi:phosphomethylpyrimidine synthase
MILSNRAQTASATSSSATSSSSSSAPSPTGYALPPLGDNPSTDALGTTPGSFANRGRVGTPWTFSSPDTPRMPAPSGKTAWDFLPEDWEVEVLDRGDGNRDATNGAADRAARADAVGSFASSPCEACATARVFTDSLGVTRRVVPPPGFEPVTQLEHARLGTITPQMLRVAQREPHLTAPQVRDEVAAGRMVIPANVNHLKHNLDPMCIGRASKTKVNANMGASPVSSSIDEEVEKLKWAEKWSADTVMDLSTGGDLNATRTAIIRNSTVPIGTVPIYSMIIGKRIEDLDWTSIQRELINQCEQGVDYMTVHAGVRKSHLPLVRNRLIGIVSRGGSLLAKWMIHHNAENPMYARWEDICDILRRYDVTFSIGDGLRPGGLADASDRAQLAELETLGELTERAWRRGVQVMIEGPGHVPFDQIEWNMKLQRTLCHGAPFYVLGPLVTDIFPGYDHITSCIGATAAAYHGASMLCYVTPKEHLGLPKKDDVKQGCVAYRIAAHAADVALGIPGSRDRDDELTQARAALNWQRHFDLSFDPELARAFHDEDLDVDTDFCAMCGHDWCSVRISKEIQDFASGKSPSAQPEKPAMRSPGISDQGAESLAARGNLTPEEIHKLAHKGKKADCHSDNVKDADDAKLVQLNTLKAHGVAVNETGL